MCISSYAYFRKKITENDFQCILDQYMTTNN
jgi:hypothetical protein